MAAALTGLAVALIAGCSNSMAGSVDGGETRMATLSISATGIPNDYAEQFAKSYPNAARNVAARNVAARSITPDTPYKPNTTGLTFYLSGTSETGKKLDDTEVSLALKTGSTDEYEFGSTVTLPSMSWNLVLTAYTDGATKAKPVLRGYCSTDLRNGSGTATFKLSPENLTTPGEVTITGKFKPNGNVASYTIGIYKKNSASEKVDEVPATYSGDGTTDENFSYNCATIAPGSYLYKMIFKNAAGTITGSFIDTLIVDAGNSLNRDIGTIDVVNKKPGAPEDFTASLETGSESADGTYRVKLGWTSGGGETNFEVELTEYTDDGTDASSATKTIYGMASMDTGTPKTVKDFQGSDVWSGKGGAMTYGDTEAYLKLKLGVVYEVRIRARNYVGISEATGVADGWTARSAGTDAPGFEAYGTEKINRMKIEYNLNGGILKYYSTSANTYEPDRTVNFTEYKTWKGTDLPLMAIGTGSPNHELAKGSSPFAEWRTDVNDPTTKVEDSDYKNLSVTAFFGSSVAGSISMADAKTDVDLDDIAVTYTTSGPSGTVTLAANNPTYTIPKMTGATPNVATTLTIQLDMSKGYKNVQFELSYNGAQTMLPVTGAGNNECQLSLDDYVAGKIQVRVIADTENAIGMSQTLTFNLQ